MSAIGRTSFTVSVTDDAGNTESQLISLSITAVNDAPTLTLISTTAFTEDAQSNAVGSVVATFSTFDAEGNTVTVTLSDTTQAQVAQREMDGTTLDGRQIRVNEAQDRR